MPFIHTDGDSLTLSGHRFLGQETDTHTHKFSTVLYKNIPNIFPRGHGFFVPTKLDRLIIYMLFCIQNRNVSAGVFFIPTGYPHSSLEIFGWTCRCKR